MLKPKVFVVGFKSDYGNIDIEKLATFFEIKRIIPSSLFVSFSLRIRYFSPRLFNLICTLYFNFRCIEISDSDVLVSDDNTIAQRCLFNKKFRKNRKICIYRNTAVVNIYSHEIEKIKAYSFDFSDCKRFGFEYYNQYCSGFDFLLENRGTKPTIDFYFLGRDKGRKEKIDELIVSFKGYTTKIIIVRSGFLKNDYVSYVEHCKNIINSRVVLDIVKEGQSGLTMRSIEALLTGRKIITNNESIFKYEGFNATNTLLIKGRYAVPYIVLKEFLHKKIEHVDIDVNIYNPSFTLKKIIDDSVVENE